MSRRLPFGPRIALVAAGIALMALVPTTSASARSTISIDLYGASSCTNGVWAVDVRVNSTLRQDLVVDAYDSSDSGTGYRKVASDIALSFQTPVFFRMYPEPGMRRDKIVLVPAGASPLNRLVDARVESPCV